MEAKHVQREIRKASLEGALFRNFNACRIALIVFNDIGTHAMFGMHETGLCPVAFNAV
jgi:hypothetical protein